MLSEPESPLRHLAALWVVGCTVLAASAGAALASDDKKSQGGSAATVENRVAEADLTTVKLAPQAEARLGIRTAAVEQRRLVRLRTLPGDVVVPHGRSVMLSAPAAAYVFAGSEGENWPEAGAKVAKGQPILRLITGGVADERAISAGDRINLAKALADLTTAAAEIRGEVDQAEVRIEAARTKLNRADTLLREQVGSQRAYDEAKSEFELAQTALAAAKKRLEAVSRILEEFESGKESSLPMLSPFDGLLRIVHVVPGQIVPAGAPLAEVFAIDPIWIRVPVYVGELGSLETSTEARVRRLADRPGEPARIARHITPPPTADPLTGSVDLYFELANPDLTFTPGERVGVAIATRSLDERLVVPRSAILYDVYGGTWVYENTAPQTFVRRRVEVRDALGELAALSRGPAIGAKVVTDGAAELFGTEFGAGK